jgi:site-specific recombinase XerD
MVVDELATVPRASSDALARLSRLADQARDYASQARAANTVKAYRSDWAHFEAWSATNGLQALPASPQAVALYLADLAATLKVSSLRRRLVAISQAHRGAGHDSPTSTPAVSAVLAGIAREKGSASTKKTPLDVPMLAQAIKAAPAGLLGMRDRALLLLGFAGAFRRSEVVSLSVADLEFRREGLVVTLRRSKTDAEGQGVRVGIPYGSHHATCPVRAVQEWIEATSLESGPLFRSINRHGTVADARLSEAAVALIVKRAASRAELDAASFSGHSMRAGFATAAAKAGVPEWRIAKQTRHRSLVVLAGYIREGSLFNENAAASVGL